MMKKVINFEIYSIVTNFIQAIYGKNNANTFNLINAFILLKKHYSFKIIVCNIQCQNEVNSLKSINATYSTNKASSLKLICAIFNRKC